MEKKKRAKKIRARIRDERGDEKKKRESRE